jgi:hypothetical protein
MTAGVLHHPPCLDARLAAGAELLQPLPLCLDVVSLDVYMDAAGVVHPLQTEIQSTDAAYKRHLWTGRVICLPRWHAERLLPKLDPSLHGLGAAINQNSG